jgi:hypothetical protein
MWYDADMSVPVFNLSRIEEEPLRIPISAVAQELVALLGRRTVAYLAGLKSVREVAAWMTGTSPHADREAILRSALQAARYVADMESADSAAAWFIGTNARFDFESPASILRERGTNARGDVVRAARAFVADALASATLDPRVDAEALQTAGPALATR